MKSFFYRLSGRTHSVYTGVVLVQSENKITRFHERTEVTMSTLSEEVIDKYIKTGEPM